MFPILQFLNLKSSSTHTFSSTRGPQKGEEKNLLLVDVGCFVPGGSVQKFFIGIFKIIVFSLFP